MKVLLDENLDHRLRTRLQPHQVFIVSYMGWSGVKNGMLLRAAEDAGFDVLMTGDQTLPYEQTLTGRRVAIVALSAIEWRILQNHLPQIIAAIGQTLPGTCVSVESGRFDRKPTDAT